MADARLERRISGNLLNYYYIYREQYNNNNEVSPSINHQTSQQGERGRVCGEIDKITASQPPSTTIIIIPKATNNRICTETTQKLISVCPRAQPKLLSTRAQYSTLRPHLSATYTALAAFKVGVRMLYLINAHSRRCHPAK